MHSFNLPLNLTSLTIRKLKVYREGVNALRGECCLPARPACPACPPCLPCRSLAIVFAVFAACAQLKRMDFSDLSCRDLDFGAFTQLTALRSFDSDVLIDTLPTSLRALHLYPAFPYNFDLGRLSHLEDLFLLDISRGSKQDMSRILKSVTSLTRLTLLGIGRVDRSFQFLNCPSLQSLALDVIPLSAWTHYVPLLPPLPSLRTLKLSQASAAKEEGLSWRPIESTHIDFSCFPQLTHLSLDGFCVSKAQLSFLQKQQQQQLTLEFTRCKLPRNPRAPALDTVAPFHPSF